MMTGTMILMSLLPIIVVGLIALAGLVLLVRGIRGEADLSFPTCSKCRYDLRGRDFSAVTACPECGNGLANPRAVLFGKYRRRPRMALLGAVMVLAPILLFGTWYYLIVQRANNAMLATMQAQAAAMMANTPAGLSAQPTSQLLQSLPQMMDEPWIWNELSNRNTAGGLTDDEITAIIDQIITQLRAQPGQANLMFGWAKDFVTAAIEGKKLSKDQLAQMTEAYYKRELEVRMRTRVRSGAPVNFFIHTGRTFDLPGISTMSSVQRVAVDDDKELKSQSIWQRGRPVSAAGNNPLAGEVALDVEPGKHTLVFCVAIWVVEGNPYTRTDDSPPALAQWSQTITIDLEVVPAEQALIRALGNDPVRAEAIRRGIRVTELRITSGEHDFTATLTLTFPNYPPAPLSFIVFVQYLDQEFCIGGFTAGEAGGSTPKFTTTLTHFPESVDHVRVVLRPNIQSVERMSNTNEVWGEEITYENVPVVRD